MSSTILLKVTSLAMIMCMILGLPKTLVALNCHQVETKLAPCIAYVKGNGGVVPQPCCEGIRALNNQAATKFDRQAICRCIKTAALAIRGLNLDTLADLPRQCEVKLPFTPGPSTDCNKIE